MKWRLYVCANEECGNGDPYRFLQPVDDDAHPDRASDMDFCPRCGEHLSFCPGGIGEIEVIQHTKGYGDIPIPVEGRVL